MWVGRRTTWTVLFIRERLCGGGLLFRLLPGPTLDLMTAPPTTKTGDVKRDWFSGTLLIVGSRAGMVVMTLHPTGRTMITPENFPRQAFLNVTVHGIALAALPSLF